VDLSALVSRQRSFKQRSMMAVLRMQYFAGPLKSMRFPMEREYRTCDFNTYELVVRSW